jgi:hypothetical protein
LSATFSLEILGSWNSGRVVMVSSGIRCFPV